MENSNIHGVWKADVANLQELFIWTLMGISIWGVKARAYGIYDETAGLFIARGLFSSITTTAFDHNYFILCIRESLAVRQVIKNRFDEAYQRAHESPFSKPVPECATWIAFDEDEIAKKSECVQAGWLTMKNETIRSLRVIVLHGLKALSAYTENACQAGKHSQELFDFLMTSLTTIADDSVASDALFKLALKTGEMGFMAMAVLDNANTALYGNPEITEVKADVYKYPEILMADQDLVDIDELLLQTASID